MRLTRKQQIFAEKIAAGLSYTDAYHQAYDCSGSKPSTVNTDASRLAKKEKIIDYVIQLHGAEAPAPGASAEMKSWDLFREFQGADSDLARLKTAKRLLRAL